MKDRVNKKRTENFTTTSNKILQDNRLSYEAIGVFMYLWSMPDDWHVMVKQVMKHNNSSEYKVRQALRELRDFGYMKWTRTQGYFIYDMCEDGTFHCGDIQHNEIHYNDNQHNDIYIQNNNSNKTITQTKDASAFSLSQSNCKENLDSSTSVKITHTQKQCFSKEFQEWYECYTEPQKTVDWNKPSISKEKLQKKFNQAVEDIGLDELMEKTKYYLLFKKYETSGTAKMGAEVFLNEKYGEDYKTKYEVVCKKQGKPLPIQQKSPEKRQEEVKMKEDTQDKRKAILSRLNAKELEFTYFLRKHLINDFSSPVHSMWIENLVFSCKNDIALIEVESEIGIRLNWEKVERILRIELQGKFEFTQIEWKLID